MPNLQFEVSWFLVQVAELYEDLKCRVAQFNMKVPEDTASVDYTSANRERFILQVGDCFSFSFQWLYTEQIQSFFQLYHHFMFHFLCRWSSLVPPTPTTFSRGWLRRIWPLKNWVASTPGPQWWYFLLLFLLYVMTIGPKSVVKSFQTSNSSGEDVLKTNLPSV